MCTIIDGPKDIKHVSILGFKTFNKLTSNTFNKLTSNISLITIDLLLMH